MAKIRAIQHDPELAGEGCTEVEAALLYALEAIEAQQRSVAQDVMKQVADAMGTNYVTAFIRALWQGLKETVTVFEAYLRNQKK